MHYTYVNSWADQNTWGGELPPQEGETVYVPGGQSLLIDQNTGHLYAIMIEGEVVVKDMDITIEANYIIIANGGKLTIGTIDAPFQNKATIILHGNQETDKQLPLYGAKVLALYDGYLTTYGKVVEPTWTKLTSSLQPGATTLNLKHAVTGWAVGDEIIITSTSYLSTQTEKRVIESISGYSITITEGLTYSHYGTDEIYGNSQTVNMAAEVGLLTRSIVIKGDDEYSDLQQYGGHILGYGTNSFSSTLQISYTEIYQAGQAKFSKRYPLNFYNLNLQPSSCSFGNSIHHSYSRMINLDTSMGIKITKNVGYDILGNGIVLENGWTIVNYIVDNLVAFVQKTWDLYATDQSPAAFLIASPNNNITGNIAAGSSYAGFHLNYDTFGSAYQMMYFSNNTAHSNYYGIYLENYDPRGDPSSAITLNCGDDSANPRILATFSNCTIFKSQLYGLIVNKIGKVQFQGFKIVDSGSSAIFLRESLDVLLTNAQIIDTLIVGKSNGNFETDSQYYTNQHGIELPANENFQLQNIWFENYEVGPALLTCASCGSYYYRTSGAQLYRTRQLGFANVAFRVKFGGNMMNEIFLDEDGTLIDQSQQTKSWYLTKWQAHLNGTEAEETEIPGCSNFDADNMYDHAIVCDASIHKFHKIQFNTAAPTAKFTNQKMKIYRFPRGSLSTTGYNFSDALEAAECDNFTNVTQYSYYKDVSGSWAMPFLTGYGYNVHFGIGIDFTSLKMKVSNYYRAEDENILIRFNHTWDRETFDENATTGCPEQVNAITKSESIYIETFNSTHANYYHNNVTKEVIVNIGGQDLAASSTIKLTSIDCRDYCPPEPPIPENVTMDWSNCTAWPSGACPIEEENVTINPGYIITMDIDPPCLGNLVINGQLLFDITRISDQEPSRLCARNIWIQNGIMSAGTLEAPFPGLISIELLGNKTSQGLVLSMVDVGNKALLVTGELQLYGKKKEIASTKLKVTANIGDTVIQIANQVDWQVGDELLITATESAVDSYETKIISSIDETDPTLITLTSPLSYLHYGDDNPITTKQGKVDIRANVTVISKSIVIKTHETDGDGAGWGFKIMETMEMNQSTYEMYSGAMILNNVRLQNCGQADLISACIEFVNSTRDDKFTELNEISIVNAKDQGILIQNSQNINIYNSTINVCSKHGIKLESALNVTISNNIIAGVLERLVDSTTQLDIVAGIYLKGDKNNQFYIQNNLVTGVTGFAYIIDAQDCSASDTKKIFTSNIAQSSTVGWYVRNSASNKCILINRFTAAKCKYGITSYQKENQFKFSLLNLIENINSIKILAGNSEDITMASSVSMDSMFFMATGRPNCTNCYSQYSLCSGQTAVRFIGFTLSYQSFPPTEYSLNKLENIFTICSEGGLSMKTTIISSEFRGFYGNSGHGVYAQCSNNRVFRTNRDTLDGASSVYLRGTECTDCDQAGLAYFDEIYGADAGCGVYNCTGLQNILISDETGGFVNSYPGQIVPKLQQNYGNILGSVSCQYEATIPGYLCSGESFGILMMQSKDADMRTRVIAPVNLTRSTTTSTIAFQNIINSFRSQRCQKDYYFDKFWQRFIGLIQLNAEYKVEFGTKTLPSNTYYKLQETADTDFVMLTINYYTGQSLRVETSTGVVSPLRLDQNSSFNEALWKTTCGANLFDYANQKISVSLLSDPTCYVNIKVVNAVKINMYFETTVDDFYQNNGIANFVDKVAAYLGINIWQLKIVSFSPFSRRLLQNATSTNDTTSLVLMIFFIESAYNAGSTDKVDQEEFTNYLKPQLDNFLSGIKSGNLSFSKKIHLIESQYASVNNSQLESSDEIQFSPNYTEIYQYQCVDLGNCEEFADMIQQINNNNGSYIVAKSDVNNDSSNTMLVYILGIGCSAIFVIIMGIIIWRIHVNNKKKLQTSGITQGDQVKFDAKYDAYAFSKQEATNEYNIESRPMSQSRATAFSPLTTTDIQKSQIALNADDVQTIDMKQMKGSDILQESKKRQGSDEQLLQSSDSFNMSVNKSDINLMEIQRSQQVRKSKFQPLKSDNDIENDEDVEVIKFE